MLLALGAPFITRKIKLHKAKREKERCFKKNHGLLFQQLVSRNSDIGGRMIITLRDLEKATNKFDPSHERSRFLIRLQGGNMRRIITCHLVNSL